MLIVGNDYEPGGEISGMTLKQVMTELKSCGTAQNVKIYRRHGARGDLFGVSFANLGILRKRIGANHDLAEQLWRTGN
ncbi:MAG: DNA alkylation repair protein, partial [candidate division Zixibacteria bacterium]|nr:DNA alkylation repair protein [candidate division Zixibacteria bacterium]